LPKLRKNPLNQKHNIITKLVLQNFHTPSARLELFIPERSIRPAPELRTNNATAVIKTEADDEKQQPLVFGVDHVHFLCETAPGSWYTATVKRKDGPDGPSRPQRLTCSRRMPYFPATVPLVCITD
jgi:hypothetical protein